MEAVQNPTNPIYKALTQNSDIIIAIAVIVILVLMIIPLPTWTLDILLTMNITFAIVVLMVALYIVKPLDLAVFPGLLLILTLFRLALNVASTRLILGQAYAGKVIEAFGTYVVKGNYIVGFIIFLLLVIINFLVIVKGAGRIAEVAARFVLDAMPGKQMAIDADLNAGIITDEEARQRRMEIGKEAEFYGAMDGASKFVRGDAIAGLIITGINIIGGFLIGVAQLGLSFSEAIQTYTRLTIGDGLVSQIPALVISTSAGMVVTRAATEANLGYDLQKQILAQPKALFIAAGALLFFGIAPGLPLLPFLMLAVIAGVLGYFSRQDILERKRKEIEREAPPPEAEERVESYLQVDPLELEIGYGLIPLVDVEQGGDLLGRITTLRKQVALDIGIIVPPIRIRDNIQLGSNSYVIKIKGIEVAKGEIMPGYYLAMNPGTVEKEIEGIKTTEPAFGLPAYWITEEQKEQAELAGYTVVEASAVIATHLMEIIKANADQILGRQDTQTLLNNLKADYPAVVDELVPGLLSVGAVQKVLQNLLREKIPIRDLVTILEALGDYAPTTKDVDALTEAVRQRLSKVITNLYKDEEGKIHAITLDPAIENQIENAIKEATSTGVPVTLPPGTMKKIIDDFSRDIEEMISKGYTPLVVTNPRIRLYLRRLIEPVFPNLMVISTSEITPTVQIESIGGESTENAD
ncbi:flagellar biosynthesis protein FlhA [candidate division KSB1 bacterium]|nr:MAG: flagellar biosynthesis protein FlhA [candidate division KSB1 bacterium]